MYARIEAARASTRPLLNIQTVASAAEVLNASIGKIVGSLARCRQKVDDMDSRAKTVDRSTGELANASSSMNGIVQRIQGSGARSTSSPLNATIEAACVGEAGRGFAVVAGAVETLSAEVTSATARIAEDIKVMQSLSGDVVGSLSVIGHSVAAIRDIVAGVAPAVEEQSAVTRQIAVSIQFAAGSVAAIDRNLPSLDPDVRDPKAPRSNARLELSRLLSV